MTTPALDRARAAYASRSWVAARDCFAEADASTPLQPADLRSWAEAVALTGDDDGYVRVLTRASQGWAGQDPARAAECAGYLAMSLALRGQWGPAVGWQQRAEELLETSPAVCAARALLASMRAIQQLMAGDPPAAERTFRAALTIARECGDPDTTALAGLGVGQALIAGGWPAEGLAQLDAVMVAVAADELHPVLTGVVYCAVIDAFQECHDARRAAEWTRALAHWCDRQPDLVPYRGQCLVHEAQIAFLQGRWDAATRQADLARARLSGPPVHPAVGAAIYQEAELHRLRGRSAEADACYALAAEAGHDPQPGLGLLRLTQGRLDQAVAGIARALEETAGPASAGLLAAAVDVDLAAGDLATARSHAARLAQLAASYDSLQLTAMSAQADAAVLVADGQHAAALPLLRQARTAWQAIDAPYFVARTREQVAAARDALGDDDGARTESAAALDAYERLGAVPDARRVRAAGSGRRPDPTRLSAREVEVLRHVAAGLTNRQIADVLVLSEKTVARHLSNIFGKLAVGSRAAATAYAYQNDLI